MCHDLYPLLLKSFVAMKRGMTLVGVLPPWRHAKRARERDEPLASDVESNDDHENGDVGNEIGDASESDDWRCTGCGIWVEMATGVAMYGSIHAFNLHDLFCKACSDVECQEEAAWCGHVEGQDESENDDERQESDHPESEIDKVGMRHEDDYDFWDQIEQVTCSEEDEEDVVDEWHDEDEGDFEGQEDFEGQQSDDVECQLAFNENAMKKMITNAENENAEDENENDNALTKMILNFENENDDDDVEGTEDAVLLVQTQPECPPRFKNYQDQGRGHLYKTPPPPPQNPPTNPSC